MTLPQNVRWIVRRLLNQFFAVLQILQGFLVLEDLAVCLGIFHGVGDCQREGLLEGGLEATRGRFRDTADLFGGRTGPEFARRHDRARRHDGSRENLGTGLDNRSVQDLGAFTDDHTVLQGGGVNESTGRHRDAVSNHRGGVALNLGHVHDGAVANGGVLTNGDGIDVAADGGAVPDAVSVRE